jgi:hypothetical protein
VNEKISLFHEYFESLGVFQRFKSSHRTSFCSANPSGFGMPDVVRVLRFGGLPVASFGFHLAMDSFASG